jgi:hypothetical protein
VQESAKEKNISSKNICSLRSFDQASFLCAEIVAIFSPFRRFSFKFDKNHKKHHMPHKILQG